MTTCLCSHCKDNAVASPGDVLCADCTSDVADAMVIPLRTRPVRPCHNGRAWCDEIHVVCEDCETDRGHAA